jgi:hypothetical protein
MDLTAKNTENTKSGASENDSLRSLRSFAVKASPLIGTCRGVGIYLLFNGIL